MFRAIARSVYGLALRTMYARTGLPWAVHDQTIRIDPRLRHLVPHASEPPVYAWLRQRIQPGAIVLDVGSFLGVYAILAARLTGPRGRVVAFEPTAWSADVARRHFEWNGLAGDSVHLIAAAVSDRPGRATFQEYDEPYVNSLVAAVDTKTTPVEREVRVVTIDDVCGELGIVPSVIRMDVQGAEIHALRGAARTIHAAGDSLAIVVEMHPQCWPAFEMNEDIARRTIRDLGLLAQPLVESEPLFARDAHAILVPDRFRARS
jgi:FkbM family methyltransferase